MLTMNHTTYE